MIKFSVYLSKAKEYLIGALLMALVAGGVVAYRSYQRFQWQNIQMVKDGPVVAIPSWRK